MTSIQPFGFTRTQSSVFSALLTAGESTGYAISRITGIARANVYQALDGLVARGVARCSGGRPAVYSAIGPDAVLARFTAETRRSLDVLARGLGVDPPQAATQDERGIRSVSDAASLVGAATRLARTARSEVFAVIGPWVPSVAEALAETRPAAATWKVVFLGRPAPDGALCRPVPRPELVAYWGGLPVVVLADREKAVCGIVNGTRCSGVETTSPGLLPFLRHLLRREFAMAAAPRVS